MSAYKVEYKAIWPRGGSDVAVDATTDKDEFFQVFDNLIAQLDILGVPRYLRPVVEVRALQWTPWESYGTAQQKGWVHE